MTLALLPRAQCQPVTMPRTSATITVGLLALKQTLVARHSCWWSTL